ncbi:MAG: hypothetical protein A2Y17_11590 [Clostridiales bacterium GWF2_38_85]|nr:MAG: hypothetical protein A2Y17_11590 [Clostridiales bacterium GWF2_38_85]HBL85344.1 hypothetical protein [Clostridiales bacterium]
MKIIKILMLILCILFIFTGCKFSPIPEVSVNYSSTSEADESITSNADISETESPKSTVSDINEESEESTPEESLPPKEEYDAMDYNYMKAMWISQFDMQSVYRNGSVQRDKASYSALVDTILDNVVDNGYNTVIVQVRPYADSFCNSSLYPPSDFITGSHSKEFTYDPFEIMIEKAHERNLSVHAWINPMRGMFKDQISSVDNKYIIKQWYNDTTKCGKYIVSVGSGSDARWYLNPAYDEVCQLIADGAAEIAQRYNVDGIHMDDYFYPTKDTSFDSAAYAQYKKDSGTLSLEDYRRSMVNKMVKLIYTSVKSVSEDIPFGISPAGNFNYTYDDLFADAKTWCSEEGYIDYLVPQIYFGLEHQNYDFVSVYETWEKLLTNENIRYYIGISLGKAKSGVDNYAGTGKNEWSEHKDVLKRCMEYLESKETCDGVVMFCYQYYYDPLSGVEVTETMTERENMAPVFAVLGN